jgi:hypothetical protein
MPAFGLEKDTRLVSRILGASDSKRTLLLNRGGESGLVVGDHAKISLPTGMLARGVVVRLSPTRSVWSVYRFTNKEAIRTNLAVAIKISSPIKLTKDESKSLGIFRDEYNKQEKDRLDKELPKAQEKIKKSIDATVKKDDKKQKLFRGNINFSSLDDPGNKIPLDPDLDWSGLDGKRDKEAFAAQLDYSTLR